MGTAIALVAIELVMFLSLEWPREMHRYPIDCQSVFEQYFERSAAIWTYDVEVWVSSPLEWLHRPPNYLWRMV